MGERARLFRSGGSQAVRLPKAYRFVGENEVAIWRDGDRVILEPIRKAWSPQFVRLAGAAHEFPYPADDMTTDPGPDFD